MRRTIRKMASYLGIVCLVGVVFAYVARDTVRDVVIHMVSAHVSKSLPGSLKVGSLRGSFIQSLALNDVTLQDAAGDTVAQIASIRFAYDLSALFKKRVLIKAVDIVQPQLNLKRMADGSLNVSRFLPTPSPEPSNNTSPLMLPLTVSLEQLHLHGGQMTIDLPSIPGVKSIDGLNLRLSGEITPQQLRITVHRLTAHAAPADLTLDNLQGAFIQAAHHRQLDNFVLEMGQTRMTADGTLPGSREPASFSIQLQPFDVAVIAGVLQDNAFGGLVNGHLTAAGPPDALRVQTKLSAAAGAIAFDSEINTVSAPLHYLGTLDIKRLNLGSLIHRDIWQSDLNIHAALKGQGQSIEQLKGQLQLTVEASRVGPLDLRPSRLDLEADRRRIHIRQFNLDTSVAQMTASGTVDLAGHSDMVYDLTADLAPLQPFFSRTPMAGKIRLKGQAKGTPEALATQALLQGSDIRIQQYRFRRLTLSVDGSELMTEPQLKTHLTARQLRVGAFPLQKFDANAAYDSQTQELRLSANAAQSTARHGSLQGQLTWAADHQDIVLNKLDLHVDDRRWQAPDPIRLTLGAGRVHLQHMKLAHAAESITLSGAVDGQTLQDISLKIDQFDLAFLRHLLSLPDVVSGLASLNLHLSGTLTEPILTSDLTLQPARHQVEAFEHVQITLAYKDQQFKSAARLHQANKDVVTFEAQLPLNMAFTPLALAQRLPETSQPVELRLLLNRPNLEGFAALLPGFPVVTGTLEGELALDGTYDGFNLDSQLQLRQLGLSESVEDLSGPLQVQAQMTTATSYADLMRRVQGGGFEIRLQSVDIKAPTLAGRLTGRPASDPPIQIEDLQVKAAGGWGRNGVQGALHALHLQAKAFNLPRVTIDVAGRLTPQLAEVTHFQARLPQSTLRGNGTLGLVNKDVTVQLEIPHLALNELMPALPANLPPTAKGEMKLHGRLDAPTLQASFQYGGAEIQANLATQFRTPEPAYRGQLQMSGFPIERLLPTLRGQAQAILQVQGTGFKPSQRTANLEFTLDVPDFSLAPDFSTHLKAKLERDTIHLERLQVRSQPATLEAQGSLAAMQDVDLNYTLTLGDLASLQDQLGVTVRASGGIAGELTGPLNDLRVQAELSLRDWAYTAWQGKSITATIGATQLTGKQQATVRAEIRDVYGPGLPESSLRLDGTYTPGKGEVTLDVTEGLYAQTALNGTAVLSDTLHVTLDRLRLQRQAIAWQNVEPVELTRDRQGTVHFPLLHLRSGDQELRVNGTLKPGDGIIADVKLNRGQILPHIHLFAPHVDIPDGLLSLDATVRGPLNQPRVEGNLAVVGLHWRQHPLGGLKAQAKLAGNTLWTDLQWHDEANDLLSLRGTWDWGNNGALDLQVKASETDLARFASLNRGILQSGGWLNLDLHVTGTMQTPEPQGVITLRDGVLQLAVTGEPYRDIQAQLALGGSRVTIERLDIESRSGPLRLKGWITHKGVVPRKLDISVQAQEFTAMHTAAIQARTSSELALRGSFEELFITGNITIPRARIRLDKGLGGGPADVNLSELTVEQMYGADSSTSTETSRKGAEHDTPAPLSFLRTDLTVEIPRNVWAQGPGTAIELRGKLRVTKALQKPFVIAGDIETVRGFASFYGKKFNLQEGKVTFPGSEDPSPFLDVVATHETGGYQISIQVEGKATQPKLQLSSTPELDQTDIVSLLVVGKTTDRLTNSEQTSLSKQGQAIAGSLVARQLEKTVGKTLGLDTIEIEAGDSLGAGSVSVGRYVTQDIFLSYRREFGERGGNSVGVEYSVTPRLKLKGSSGDLGDSGVDILWRLDY